MEYFLTINGQNIGPITAERVFDYPVTPETLIWHEGLTDWIPLKQDSALFTEYINRNPEPPKFIDSQTYTVPGVSPIPRHIPPKPSSYLAFSIIMTICCCLFTGIIAIVYSTKVDSAYYNGDYEKAFKYSKTAYWLNIGSLIFYAVCTVLYALFIFILPYWLHNNLG